MLPPEPLGATITTLAMAGAPYVIEGVNAALDGPLIRDCIVPCEMDHLSSVLWSPLFGVLPGQPGITWQAHLCGALTGLLAARMVGRAASDSRSGSAGYAG